MQKDAGRIGFWSAISAAVFSIIYIIPQLLMGIEMPSTPKDLIIICGPSLPLALAFLVVMVCVHYYAPEEKKVWSHIGIVFSTSYFVFVSIVYFVVLTVLVPHIINGEIEKVVVFNYVPRSFMTAIDALGYTSMSLATLFTAPIFRGSGLKNWIRRVFFIHGLLAPVILMTQIYPNIAYAGALWIVTFPLSMILLAVMFKRETINKSPIARRKQGHRV